MLVGLERNWKQPVAYYLTHNGCNSEILQKCIFEALKAAEEIAKVDVIATVCDMGVSNVKCLKNLGVTINTPYFYWQQKKIFTMYDPPHLLKCCVSLFRKYNVFLPVGRDIMEARFSDIRNAHEKDKCTPYVFRTMHKITDHHLQPIMQYSMKVSIAAQLMSHTVAAYLYSLATIGKWVVYYVDYYISLSFKNDRCNGSASNSHCNIYSRDGQTL